MRVAICPETSRSSVDARSYRRISSAKNEEFGEERRKGVIRAYSEKKFRCVGRVGPLVFILEDSVT